MARRGAGEGSIYPVCGRKGTGHDKGDHKGCTIERWMGQLPNGHYPNGKRKFYRPSAKTHAGVVAKMNQARRSDVIPDRTTTMATFLEQWLTTGLRDGTATSTASTYRSGVKNWLVPSIGAVKLGDLQPAHVTRMLGDLEARGLLPSTRGSARRLLVRALKWAESNEWVRRNVASVVDGPKHQKAAKLDDVLDAEQAGVVLRTAKAHTDDLPNGDRFEAAAVLGLRLGLRIGEVIALRWDDIDDNVLHVRRSKTSAGVRDVELRDNVAQALNRRRAHQNRERLAAGPLWRDTGYVFTSDRGDGISDSAMRSWWHRLCSRAGVPHARFHAARHCAAVLMLDAGLELERVSAVLGHANLSTTSDVYAQVTRDSKRRALDVLDGVLAAD